MRKKDPAAVRVAFADEADEILAYFDRVAAAVKDTASEKKDITALATNSFLAFYVAFERFLSDLFLAYLNRDLSAYQADLMQRVGKSIEDKFGKGVGSLVSLQTKKHIKVSELEGIVDPDGWNLTFPSVEKLKATAQVWLATGHSTRIQSISAHEARLIETARAIRDFIAHQSPGAKAEMNNLLATVEQGGHNHHLGRGGNDVHSVGSYLKAVFAGRRRLHRYADGLKSIGAHL